MFRLQHELYQRIEVNSRKHGSAAGKGLLRERQALAIYGVLVLPTAIDYLLKPYSCVEEALLPAASS
jgi:hypothetical protein